MIDLPLLVPDKKPADVKVCVAMSGGVDSTAAVLLLKQAGYDVFGMTLDLLQAPYAPDYSSIADAAKVAEQIGISHYYVDAKAEFKRDVVDYFAESYLKGETPSPCILCNRYLKLGLLIDKARALGVDVVVTGHYADILLTTHGVELHRAKDLVRDQSYFLSLVAKENLQMLRCPLAEFSKEDTRKIVQEAGIEIFNKPDSQDICFVSQGKYAELIHKLHPDFLLKKGDIVTTDGRVLGQHNGIIHYTVGQRRGLGIGGGPIYYVLRLDALKNQVVVGAYDELKCSKVFLRDVNWLGEEQPDVLSCEVKLRSRQNLVAAEVKFLAKNRAEVSLLGDFYGSAAGQGCCFYVGSRVLGGGIIENVTEV